MATLRQLENEILRLKHRNLRVEADKAWEVSWTRRILITVLTYLVIVVFFYFAELPDPWANSVVPALAFVLSQASMPFFKKLWLQRQK